MMVVVVSLLEFVPYMFCLLVIGELLDWVYVAFTKGRLGGSSR